MGRLVYIEATVNGIPGKFLLDTGGGITLLTPDLARSTGCGAHGGLTGFRMTGERVAFQKCGSVDVTIGSYRRRLVPGVFDLMALLPPDFPRLDGVLALDAFDGETVTLDLSAQQMIVETPVSSARRTRSASLGVMRVERELAGAGLRVFVRVPAQTGDLYLLLDNGNLDNLILSPAALAQLGQTPPENGVQTRVNLELYPRAGDSVDATVRELIIDGALSQRIIARYRLTLDLRNQRIWFERIGDASAR